VRITNLLFFLSLLLIPVYLTTLFSARGYIVIFSYFIFLTQIFGVFNFLVFFKQYLHSRKYEIPIVVPTKKYKVAAVIPTYNEDPETVIDTALSVELAVKNYGDVYILDDSTNEEIKRKLDEYCKTLGIRIFRRGNRRGYKAGAINDFLKSQGYKYDLIAVFDADQRPLSSFFDEVLGYFDDPAIAFVQVPQSYTELETGVAEGALYQQIPFQYSIHIECYAILKTYKKIAE